MGLNSGGEALMPKYIIKLSEENTSWYLEYSSVVDAPITYGMSLEEFKEYYQEEYGRSSMAELENRLQRVEERGTSSHVDTSVEEQLAFNRAGENETCLSIKEIINKYCKNTE